MYESTKEIGTPTSYWSESVVPPEIASNFEAMLSLCTRHPVAVGVHIIHFVKRSFWRLLLMHRRWLCHISRGNGGTNFPKLCSKLSGITTRFAHSNQMADS